MIRQVMIGERTQELETARRELYGKMTQPGRRRAMTCDNNLKDMSFRHTRELASEQPFKER
jgi:hypothetical protein